MNTIEKRYREEIGRWTGQQRVQRTASLLGEVRVMLRHREQSRATRPLSESELRRAVAARLYRTDPRTQRLIARLEEADESGR
ncbi:MAG: hypothetical protein DWQ36_14515 [Acidobacteria bacterium]|nr:MAG: hypothetical protein DWQ30_03250 [Acidobacteriota bacterium]REK06105.1 MAG: hypothetical protein DWQ36_14515 [Acidobacteriota bacterium]